MDIILPAGQYTGSQIRNGIQQQDGRQKQRSAGAAIGTLVAEIIVSEWKPGDEPYYPVNDDKNGKLYVEYKKLADKESRVIFGGRLGEYKYYDMDQVIAAALDRCEKEFRYVGNK